MRKGPTHCSLCGAAGVTAQTHGNGHVRKERAKRVPSVNQTGRMVGRNRQVSPRGRFGDPLGIARATFLVNHVE